MPLILKGSKTVTWRMFDDKDLQVGDMIQLINKDTGENFTLAKIIKIQSKKLGEMSESDFNGRHERFATKDAMLITYKSYYGDKVTFESPVKIVHFDLISTNE